MVPVVILAEARLYRDGLAEAIRRWEGIELVGAVSSPREVVDLGPEAEEAVVVLDQSPPLGIRTLQTLVEDLPRCRVVALAVPDDEGELLEWIEAGATGFVSRSASLSELRTAVSAAASGELLCSPRCAARLAQRLRVISSTRSVTGETLVLTRREREIVGLIDQGRSNKEIGIQLSIELSTVKNHIRHIFEKLHVHRRTEAAAWVGGRLSRREGEALDSLGLRHA